MRRNKMTETQRKYLADYLDGVTIYGVAEKFGVGQSTVSRTIHRPEV